MPSTDAGLAGIAEGRLADPGSGWFATGIAMCAAAAPSERRKCNSLLSRDITGAQTNLGPTGMPKHFADLSKMKLFQSVMPVPYEKEIARIGQLSTELQKQIYRLESLLLCISQERSADDNSRPCHDHAAGSEPSRDAVRDCTDKTTYARYEDLLFLSNMAHQRANEMVTGQWMASAACPGSLILFLPVQELFSESTSTRADGDDGKHHKQRQTFSTMHIDKEFAAFEYSARDFEDIQVMLEFVTREIKRLASDIKGARRFVRDLLYWQHSAS